MMDDFEEKQLEELPEAGNGDPENGAPDAPLPEDSGEQMGTVDEGSPQDEGSSPTMEYSEDAPEPDVELAPAMETSAASDEASPEPPSPEEQASEVEGEPEQVSASLEDEPIAEGEQESEKVEEEEESEEAEEEQASEVEEEPEPVFASPEDESVAEEGQETEAAEHEQASEVEEAPEPVSASLEDEPVVEEAEETEEAEEGEESEEAAEESQGDTASAMPLEAFIKKFGLVPAGELPAEEEMREEDAEAEEYGEDVSPLQAFAQKFSIDEPGEVAEAEKIPEAEGETGDGRAWYVVHCYSGYENKVRHNLEQRIDSMGMKDLIFDVVVPTEEEIEVKEGRRRTVERRVFPGYILVNMIMTEESWYVVRNTPGVTSFVGMGNDPTPLRAEEVSQIVKRMEADAPRIKVTFKPGERVRIMDGPFNDFRGTVSEIDMERAKVRVMVNFFGRETPVELDFLQVEKA